jgi:phage tail sheath gpL-like
MREQENSSLWRDSFSALWSTQENRERKLFLGQWNLAIRGSRIATFTRIANDTMVTKVQTSFSPEIQWVWAF